ncbi:glycosyltransferase [Acidipila sp. EB88]|uniref:glycosyltransferase n=1 Tax=Acidipila sp. EB88 TaxID=2305226 RepID=UPI000F5F7F32|nr:glycosyltransferase [Acidipila sp. EB88]RRA47864.1 glycosyltransferase [Acidipila sp. EB88]
MKPVFYDPERKRWKRLRRVLDVVAILSTVVLVLFITGVLRKQSLPGLAAPDGRRNFHAYVPAAGTKLKGVHSAHRKTLRRPSDIPLNQDEGLRAAFYTNEESSYASFKAHVHQIDILFPDWLHLTRPDGALQAIGMYYPANFYNVVDKQGVHGIDPDNRVDHVISAAKEATEVFPMLNNYNVQTNKWNGELVANLLKDPAARERLHVDLDKMLSANARYRGICMDFEEVPDKSHKAYAQFLAELHQDFAAKGLRIYVNVAAEAEPAELRAMSQATDGVILMNYDEHEDSGEPGPVASQDWFENNVSRALKIIPKQKILLALGNYGYDWQQPIDSKGKLKSEKVEGADSVTVQESWDRAADAGAAVSLNGDELNPHFAYDDDDEHVRHQVWFLDGVTALNEMRAARQMGLRTFALWRLGSEDPTLWNVWDHPSDPNAPAQLQSVPPGADVHLQGEGDILRIQKTPQFGQRQVFLDSGKFTVTDEAMLSLPHPFELRYYGYDPRKLALTFDDGPDPTWTPRVLDVLKKYNVHAAFMVIGEAANDNVGLLKRYLREGHEIGNHTYTHPDISEVSDRQVRLELNLTERLFGAELGVQPLYFRPPYSIDQEPDTNDQAAPAYQIQQMGYTIIGNKIDTDDWAEHPRKTPQQIVDHVLEQIEAMKDRPDFRGSIILMHDGGGDRSVTVATLPLLITTMRARGYEFVPVSELMGKTRAEVMPALSPRMWWQARVDSAAFFLFSSITHFVVGVFVVGDVLMSTRLLIIGVCALIDRFRVRKTPPGPFKPQIAVLVPAYNEETVIVRTVRSVLRSDYPNLRVIVIDDGSTDATLVVAREAYRAEIASGRVTVITKPNAGKAEALNFAIEHLAEEFYVGIDADTVIAPDAISRLVCHFADERIGAVAGNAKVGNRVNLWTRWQALEYITSQNFERRALDLFNVVTVVPGAIGAWRTSAVRDGGCYPVNTVAEDADLTMNLLEQNYKVIYEDRALAFTEAPVTARGLMRQRFRWSFGILQAVFKHKQAIRTNRAMGLFALPNILIFQILLPLVSPFIDLMFLAGLGSYLWQKYFHPEAASASNFEKLLVYFATFLVIDFVTSALAFSLERKHPSSKGDGLLLFHIWLQRFSYRQLFSLVLFKTLKRAIDGRPFNWDKLERTAKMSKQTEQITAGD